MRLPKFPWNRPLPVGKALFEEAERRGVSWIDTAESERLKFPPTSDEWELQRRVLAARADRVLAARADQRNQVTNWVQTAGILAVFVGSLITIMVILHLHSEDQKAERRHRQEDQQSQRRQRLEDFRAQAEERQGQANLRSAELMLRFADKLSSGLSARVEMALQLHGNLDKVKVSDAQLDDFLGNYELLDNAYRYGLINNDMAYNAFSYDLENAMRDRQIREFITASRREDKEEYEGVLELAACLQIDTSFLPGAPPCPRPKVEPPPKLSDHKLSDHKPPTINLLLACIGDGGT